MTLDQARALLLAKTPIVDQLGIKTELTDGFIRMTVGGLPWASAVDPAIKLALSVAERLSGRVLIGGLGIGLVPRLLAERPEIEQIVILDTDSRLHVILGDLATDGRVVFIPADIWQITEISQFDSAFIDIWDDFIHSVPAIGASCGQMRQLLNEIPLVLTFPEEVENGAMD